MPATVLTLADVRDAILRDIRNLRPEADIGSDSDYFVRASSVASAVEGLYQHQLWMVRQIFPDTADRDFLILHARLRGMDLKPAVIASGAIRLTGTTPGTPVPSGLAAKYQDGTAYVTTAGGQLDANGQAIVTAAAILPGEAGNRAVDDGLTLTVPPGGINATATVVTMRGGTEIETPESLLARLLQRIRRPPAGGNKYDYWQWAMGVPGVSAAFVYPLRRGLGTVDVVVVSATGLPSDDVLKAAQAHIDDQRPVTAKNARVVAPTIRAYDVDATIVRANGTRLDDVRAAIERTLRAYDAVVIPGDTVVRNRIGAMISDTTGIVDYVLNGPADNIVPAVEAAKVEWCRLGNITIRDKA